MLERKESKSYCKCCKHDQHYFKQVTKISNTHLLNLFRKAQQLHEQKDQYHSTESGESENNPHYNHGTCLKVLLLCRKLVYFWVLLHTEQNTLTLMRTTYQSVIYQDELCGWYWHCHVQISK